MDQLATVLEKERDAAAAGPGRWPQWQWRMRSDQLGHLGEPVSLVTWAERINVQSPNARTFHHDAPIAAEKALYPTRDLIEVAGGVIGRRLDAAALLVCARRVR